MKGGDGSGREGEGGAPAADGERLSAIAAAGGDAPADGAGGDRTLLFHDLRTHDLRCFEDKGLKAIAATVDATDAPNKTPANSTVPQPN